VVREALGVGSNVQPVDAKRKRVLARCRQVRTEMHGAGEHLHRVGGHLHDVEGAGAARGAVGGERRGLGDKACAGVRGTCESGSRK
jgi:hypothetical protein